MGGGEDNVVPVGANGGKNEGHDRVSDTAAATVVVVAGRGSEMGGTG